MKKYLKFTVTALLLVALVAGAMFTLAACKEDEPEDKGAPIVNFYRPENDLPYLTKTYADGSQCEDDFKIVTFTDPHFNGDKNNSGDAVSLTLIENTIKLEKPDLIVFLGDNCLGANTEQAIDNLGELFEKYNQYWGYVLGNHDGESKAGPARSELTALYGKFEHCIITPVEGIYGYGNCIINIKKVTGEVIQSLVFIDTGDYVKEEYCIEYGFTYNPNPTSTQYDFIKYDQIEWYKSTMNSIFEKNNGVMPNSIMFTHIPLVEYQEAFNEAKNKGEIISGNQLEPVCSSLYNTGMFEAIIEVGSTRAVIAGHDHTNDFIVSYQGVNLLYSQTTAYNSYLIRKHELYLASYIIDGELGEGIRFNDGHTEFSISITGEMRIIPRINQDNPALFEGVSEEHRREQKLDLSLPK